jgi:hypothetical protein
MLILMKYYIYISDAKVDMLLPQIPHEIKKKVATEYGVDLKFLIAKRKVESEAEDNRITRLEAVLAFIREYGNVGSVDQPDEYCEGIMPMRFLAPNYAPVVYVSGHTEKTMLGLGGSAKHMIGAVPAPNSPTSSSFTYAILDALSQLDSQGEVSEDHGGRRRSSSSDSVHRQSFRFGSLRTHDRRSVTNLSAFETCNTTAARVRGPVLPRFKLRH